jgi:polar amino acid transport system substrate-binding protein
MSYIPTGTSGTLRFATLGIITAFVLSSIVPAAAQTVQRIRDSGTIKLGYGMDARPFSYQSDTGQAAGYAVSVCTMVAEELKQGLGLADLKIKWIPVERNDRLEAVKSGQVDVLCGANSVTLSRRALVSFSLPIFPGGIGALLRANSPLALREVLAQGAPADRPVWRGSPARTVLERKTFSTVAGTTSETWLKDRIAGFKLDATVAPVDSYDEGIDQVLNGSADVLFGDLPILMDAAARRASSGDLIVLDRQFTFEPLALALPRGDEDFRLAVDTALSKLYRSEGFNDFVKEWFGSADSSRIAFFRQTALPE